MNILVHAYQLSPYRGSEHSVAWNYLMEMGKEHSITVLYGDNGNHMGVFDPVEDYVRLIGERQITFIPVPCEFFTNLLNTLNRHGICYYSFYFAYNLWERTALKYAKELVKENDYDLIHFLGPIGFREPGYLWTLPIPYLWGPVNGFTNYKAFLLSKASFPGKIRFTFRSIVNTIQQSCSFRVRRALKRADRIISATTETQQTLLKKYGVESTYIPENGINSIISHDCLVAKHKRNDVFNMIWIGRIDDGKALWFLLDALTLIPKNTEWKLMVLGDGPQKTRMMELAQKNNIDERILWTGNIARSQVQQYIDKAHCHIITSLMEANTTVIWETMSRGVPTISFDHCGMHDTVCKKCGILIPLFNTGQIVHDLANAIQILIDDRDLANKLSFGCLECSKKYTQNIRHKFFNQQYKIAIEHFNRKTRG